MKKKLLNYIKIFLYLLPFFLGVFGFCIMEKEPVFDAAFNSLLFYILGYTESPSNVFVELGRWMAPAVTASGVIYVFNSLRSKIVCFIGLCKGKSVAVYGPDAEKEAVLEEIKKYGIDGKENFIPATKYILLDDEEKNFTFYNTYKEKFKDSTVYLRCQSLPSEAINSDSRLQLFCPEETAARLFWKKYFLYPLFLEKNHKLDIVFIGFDKLGEELLLYGLQNNIFSPDQEISYHIFGDGERFRAIHTELDSISDPIMFYDEPWYLNHSLIETADMVIVLTQEKQASVLQELLFSTIRSQIHVFAANASHVTILSETERLQIFDWKTESLKLEYIMNDSLFYRAKRINLRYAHLYANIPENDASMESEWKKLDTFTRYSNISSADYHEVRLKMLNKNIVTEDELELYSELEHIRWCRYHYLNNWKYGIPKNGKNKDKLLRIHKDLVSYQSLTDGEKEKDRENIRILHSI